MGEFQKFRFGALQVDSLRQAQEKCTLRIITINDVYELGNLPYLDGVIRLSNKHAIVCNKHAKGWGTGLVENRM